MDHQHHQHHHHVERRKSLCKRGEWSFLFKKRLLTDEELDKYHQKLLELREKYQEKISHLSNCKFYSGDVPPTDNIFGSFLYECKRHTPKCQGWFLLWNPNLGLNDDKLTGSLHNHCATLEYKVFSKRIQKELEDEFEDLFELCDDDDTHPYYYDMYFNLNYAYSQNPENHEELSEVSPALNDIPAINKSSLY